MEGRTGEPTSGGNRNSPRGSLNNFRAIAAARGFLTPQSGEVEPESAFFRIFFNSSAKPLFLMMRLKLVR